MIDKSYIDQMQIKVHGLAREKGWWTGPNGDYDVLGRPMEETLLLVCSEISEALEDWRKTKDVHHVYEEEGKPCGFSVEIADACIRMLDLAGAWEFDFGDLVETGRLFYDHSLAVERLKHTVPPRNTPIRHLMNANECLSRAWHFWEVAAMGQKQGLVLVYDFSYWLAVAFAVLVKLCEQEKIDLTATIDRKHEFNKTRPYRHGNKHA